MKSRSGIQIISNHISNNARSRSPPVSKLRADGYDPSPSAQIPVKRRQLKEALANFESILGQSEGHEEVRNLVALSQDPEMCEEALQLDTVLAALAKSGFLQGSGGNVTTQRLIQCLAEELEEWNQLGQSLKLRSIIAAFDALRNHYQCDETTAFIVLLSDQLRRNGWGQRRLSAWEIAIIMCALRRYREDDTTRGIIQCLTQHLVNRSVQFHEHALNFVLTGLENHSSSDSSEAFLNALIGQQFGHLEEVEVNTMVNALQCLRNHSCCWSALQILRMLEKKTSFSKPHSPHAAISGLIALQDYPCIPSTANLLQRFIKIVIEPHRSVPSPKDICDMLAGLQNHPTSGLTRKFISKCVEWLPELKYQINPSSFSAALCGLANQKSTPESRSLLKKVLSIPKCGQWTDGYKDVYAVLSGLKLHEDSEEVRNVYKFLLERLQEVVDDEQSARFSKEEVADLSSILKDHSSKEALNLLKAIVSRTNAYPLEMSPDVLGGILTGLKNHSSSPVCDEILKTLERHLQKCNVKLHDAGLFTALSSFQNMSPGNGSTKVLQALLQRLQESKVELSAHTIVHALAGLRLHSKRQIGQDLFAAFVPRIENCLDELSEEDFKTAVKGLEGGICQTSSASLQVFEALLYKIESFSSQAILNALSPLSKLSWRAFGKLVYQIRRNESTHISVAVLGGLHNKLDRKDPSFCIQDVVNVVKGLEEHGSSEVSSLILKSLGSKIGAKIKEEVANLDESEANQSMETTPLKEFSADDIVDLTRALHNHYPSAGIDELLKSFCIVMHVLKLKITVEQLIGAFEGLGRNQGSKGFKVLLISMSKHLNTEEATEAQVAQAETFLASMTPSMK